MRRVRAICRQSAGVFFTGFSCLSVALITMLAGDLTAHGSEITRIEEEWELVVSEPDPDNNAPQITCVMSPVPNTDLLHMALEINHKTLPDYDSGGVQLQLWNGETPVVARNSPVQGVLHHAGETVRWTTSMRLHDGVLTFEVKNGSSTSWGAFGGQGWLKASKATGLSSLVSYSADTSCAKSGIGFAANRVTSLVLKEVRYYLADELVYRDTTQRVVHPHD